MTRAHLSVRQVGELRSRDYDLRPVKDLAFDEIGSQKAAEPRSWFPRVIASIASEGIIQPILVTTNGEHLELIDGNHRAWAAYQQQMPAPTFIFTPACGHCTEAMFTESAMAQTLALGWKY
nr:ParB/RepB/Spo0J family partition protein [Pseudactinotalea sp. HY160]